MYFLLILACFWLKALHLQSHREGTFTRGNFLEAHQQAIYALIQPGGKFYPVGDLVEKVFLAVNVLVIDPHVRGPIVVMV